MATFYISPTIVVIVKVFDVPSLTLLIRIGRTPTIFITALAFAIPVPAELQDIRNYLIISRINGGGQQRGWLRASPE